MDFLDKQTRDKALWQLGQCAGKGARTEHESRWLRAECGAYRTAAHTGCGLTSVGLGFLLCSLRIVTSPQCVTARMSYDTFFITYICIFLLIYFFVEVGGRREKEWEGNINQLPLAHPQPGPGPQPRHVP